MIVHSMPGSARSNRPLHRFVASAAVVALVAGGLVAVSSSGASTADPAPVPAYPECGSFPGWGAVAGLPGVCETVVTRNVGDNGWRTIPAVGTKFEAVLVGGGGEGYVGSSTGAGGGGGEVLWVDYTALLDADGRHLFGQKLSIVVGAGGTGSRADGERTFVQLPDAPKQPMAHGGGRAEADAFMLHSGSSFTYDGGERAIFSGSASGLSNGVSVGGAGSRGDYGLRSDCCNIVRRGGPGVEDYGQLAALMLSKHGGTVVDPALWPADEAIHMSLGFGGDGWGGEGFNPTGPGAGGSGYASNVTDGFGGVAILRVQLATIPVAVPVPKVKPAFVTPSSLPKGKIGKRYVKQLKATGTAPLRFAVTAGRLPKGVKLSKAGQIAGVPKKAGTCGFTVKASNAAGSASHTYKLSIKKRH
ncbi:MAG: hypothetical protein J0H64_04535 [Actinobacteria bacterium]|nr:hypothetical protein [Actinomycetota bacterium]